MSATMLATHPTLGGRHALRTRVQALRHLPRHHTWGVAQWVAPVGDMQPVGYLMADGHGRNRWWVLCSDCAERTLSIVLNKADPAALRSIEYSKGMRIKDYYEE